ncbi:MAG: hypothetical protein ACQESH_07845, partial [Campylobacterota bacterium]
LIYLDRSLSRYKEFIHNLLKHYIARYKNAYQVALKMGKKREFITLVKSQIQTLRSEVSQELIEQNSTLLQRYKEAIAR